MDRESKIYVAGHRGLAGSALIRVLSHKGFGNLVTRTHAELDLADPAKVDRFFGEERPEYVFLAAAKVGGILANATYPADFIHQNLAIQGNVIHASWRHGVRRLLFLGSSCIYPRMAAQPMRETSLLTGPLEPTNRPYAIAKIAGIEMCSSYNRQYGTRFLAAMPTNLYGPGDNYHPHDSHVIPGLIQRFHAAKVRKLQSVRIWGTGQPRREFLFSDDMADACVFLMGLPEAQFSSFLGKEASLTAIFEPPLVNIGVGEDLTIFELAGMIRDVVGYGGKIELDPDKPDGSPRKLLDVSRLKAAGWSPRTSLAQGLALAYNDYLERMPTSPPRRA